MPIRLSLPPTFRDRLTEADRPQAGMWVCSGSPVVAEICAGSGLDWLLIDAEQDPPAGQLVFRTSNRMLIASATLA